MENLNDSTKVDLAQPWGISQYMKSIVFPYIETNNWQINFIIKSILILTPKTSQSRKISNKVYQKLPNMAEEI